MIFTLADELSRGSKIRNAKLYCITTAPPPGKNYSEIAEEACRGGADVIQFREKKFSADKFIEEGKKLRAICRRFDALFIVNDRLDAALACEADGVHLGQEDCPVPEAREIADRFFDSKFEIRNSKFLIGCSTHSIEQALRAEEDGADYIGCGPVFPTPTKPDYSAVGLDLVREYAKRIKIPFVAIGGIDHENVKEVLRAGAPCIAAVRAVFNSGDIESAVRSLKNKIAVNTIPVE